MFPANSPPYNAISPPSTNRPMMTAAAAAAALKRSSPAHQSNQRRQSGSSSSGATPGIQSVSRQGSVETERENSSTPHATGPGTGTGDETQNEDQENESSTKGGGTNATDSQQAQQDAEAEEEDENKEDLLEADMDAFMQAQMEKQKEDMKLLLENFSSEQLQRYEAYRRSALNRTNVRRLVSQVLNQQCSQTMAIVVAGFSKVYVGEIVEKAREVMEDWGHTGAIRPEHLREANRRYKKEQSATSSMGQKLTLMR
ncbi:hTAFII28-like protein conserved region-domain-containing protein [Phascolomyces articulosus]|uniref:Transcription initiation factor TFIID subunit 11 n=1 Tax=Phascolomyces articulosus TaxID=60185 RepID=A0AAD5K4I6_9FUNG|nr:hTAFII28-like protein conserved region-domain-containing protein [Phascolomyces articulosus]